jgi:hypothetical protein
MRTTPLQALKYLKRTVDRTVLLVGEKEFKFELKLKFEIDSMDPLTRYK